VFLDQLIASLRKQEVLQCEQPSGRSFVTILERQSHRFLLIEELSWPRRDDRDWRQQPWQILRRV